MSGARRSSGQGWALSGTCPRCGRPEDRCRCPAAVAVAGGPPTLRLRMEKRRGKPVTVLAVEGIPQEEIRALAKDLKTQCGAGGTVRDGELELQGEHRERLRSVLTGRGYRVKG